MRIVHGNKVHGVDVDTETRCRHWNSPVDIIAIKFKCCGKWYPCNDCHSELAVHEPDQWTRSERDEKAVLCGGCGRQLSINEYLGSGNVCPGCERAFNPGCAKHYDLYFE